jgi:hypothetical protein
VEDVVDEGLPVAGPVARAEALEIDLLEEKQVQAEQVEVIDRAITLPKRREPVGARGEMTDQFDEQLGKIRAALGGLGAFEVDDAGDCVVLPGVAEKLMGMAIAMDEAGIGHVLRCPGNLCPHECVAGGAGGGIELRRIGFPGVAPPRFHALA